MTDIEKKALELVNEVKAEWNMPPASLSYIDRDVVPVEALCRAIEQHEAFQREVSEELVRCGIGVCHPLHKFILPKPVDPLVEAWKEAVDTPDGTPSLDRLRAGIEARGGKIVWDEA